MLLFLLGKGFPSIPVLCLNIRLNLPAHKSYFEDLFMSRIFWRKIVRTSKKLRNFVRIITRIISRIQKSILIDKNFYKQCINFYIAIARYIFYSIFIFLCSNQSNIPISYPKNICWCCCSICIIKNPKVSSRIFITLIQLSDCTTGLLKYLKYQ